MRRPDDRALIGPNAIIQLRHVLARRLGEAEGRAIFVAAGQERLWDQPPSAMLSERAVRDVHDAVVRTLCPTRARVVLAEAGRLTAEYLLANRIPRLARRMLPLLPASFAARLLMRAVARNAWTFCGSGEFGYRFETGLHVLVRDNPIAVDAEAPWHRAVFETLFRRLVSPACEILREGGPSARVADTAFLIRGPGFGLQAAAVSRP